MPTREAADRVAVLFRRHDAFQGGQIEVEGRRPYRADHHSEEPEQQYHVLYTGPLRHHRISASHGPLGGEDAKVFEDRAAADHACAAARRQIPADELSAVYVDADGDSGPWHLACVYAAVKWRESQ